jgi:hypothetical protein
MSDICSCKDLIENFDTSIKNKPSLCMAYLAHLAYHNFDFIQSVADKTNANSIKFYSHTGTQAFLIEYESFACVAFRGTTSEKTDIRTDFKFWKRDWFGIRAHHGFTSALDKILPDLLEDLQLVVNKPIYYSGHSLGGALATLLCVAYTPTYLATFGCPRVASGANFKNVFEKIKVRRFINLWDIVSYVPQTFFGYSHISKPIIIYDKLINPFKAHYSTEYIKRIDDYYRDKQDET